MEPRSILSDVALEIVSHIQKHFDEPDYATVATFARVSRVCSQAAATLLYRTVDLEKWNKALEIKKIEAPPRLDDTHFQDGKSAALSDLGAIVEEEEEEEEERLPSLRNDAAQPEQQGEVPPWLLSARLAHNADYVTCLVLKGWLLDEAKLDAAIADAIPHWPNLSEVLFDPPSDIYGNITFITVRDTLLSRSGSITHLTLGEVACRGEASQLWAGCTGLRQLNLQSPGRALLDVTPLWLHNNSGTLEGFHARGNCGSITPGVLRSFTRPLVKIRSFSMGISYSVTHLDMINFLNTLPMLTTLDLGYYWQLAVPKRVPAFPTLKSFTLRHSLSGTRAEANTLCTFARRLIAGSRLEQLRLILTGPAKYLERVPGVAHDALIHHVCSRHAGTFRVLHAPRVFFGHHAVTKLVRECQGLEELNVASTDRLNHTEIVEQGGYLRILSTQTRNAPIRTPTVPDQTRAEELFIMSHRLVQFGVDNDVWSWDRVGKKIFRVGEASCRDEY